jgi:hypothetical protein
MAKGKAKQPKRDWLDVKIGGKTHRLRLTFEAIEAIEDRLDKTVLGLLTSGEPTETLRFRDVVIVLQEALRAGGVELEYKDLADEVFAAGYGIYTTPVAVLLMQTVMAGPEAPATSAGDEKSVS